MRIFFSAGLTEKRHDPGARAERQCDRRDIQYPIPVQIEQKAQSTVSALHRLHFLLLS